MRNPLAELHTFVLPSEHIERLAAHLKSVLGFSGYYEGWEGMVAVIAPPGKIPLHAVEAVATHAVGAYLAANVLRDDPRGPMEIMRALMDGVESNATVPGDEGSALILFTNLQIGGPTVLTYKEARVLASQYHSSGYIGRTFAAFASGYPVSYEDFMTEVQMTADECGFDSHADMERLREFACVTTEGGIWHDAPDDDE